MLDLDFIEKDKAMADHGLFKDYTMQELLDEFTHVVILKNFIYAQTNRNTCNNVKCARISLNRV